MHLRRIALALALTAVALTAGDGPASLWQIETKTLDGQPAKLEQYKGKVVLVVNVASECGFTRQYEGLQALQEKLGPRGFTILAFPSNEFGGQEPGDAAEIKKFCESKYKVTFPLFEKCEVKAGEKQSPVYKFLAAETKETPSWNFCKYLVGKDGKPIKFFPSKVAPESGELNKAIEEALKAPDAKK